MPSLSDDFCELQGIITNYRTLYYQLTGDIQSRIPENTKTLSKLMDQFEIGFVEEHDIVFNVISKAVLLPLFATEVINHTSIRHAAYQDFISNRFHGYLFALHCRNVVWNLLKQITKRLEKKVSNKVVQLCEEKNLLTIFFITARKRTELNLEEALGNFEFSMEPKALFFNNG